MGSGSGRKKSISRILETIRTHPDIKRKARQIGTVLGTAHKRAKEKLGTPAPSQESTHKSIQEAPPTASMPGPTNTQDAVYSANDPPFQLHPPMEPDVHEENNGASLDRSLETSAEPTGSPEPLSSNVWIDMLSTRTVNCLGSAGIISVAELKAKSPEELLSIPHFGSTCLTEVEWFLKLQDLTGLDLDDLDAPMALTAPLSSNPFFATLSYRTRTRLTMAGIDSLADLCEMNPEKLFAIRGFGALCMIEVDRLLEANNLLPLSSSSEHGGNANVIDRNLPLSAEAQAFLEQLGIRSGQEVKDKNLSELLAASNLSVEVLEEVFAQHGFPRLSDEHELLLLLSISQTARVALSNYDSLGASIHEILTRCRQKVERQVQNGTLHDRALMDWYPIQDFNVRMNPPAATVLDLISRTEHMEVPDGEVVAALDRLDAALDAPNIESEVEYLLGQFDDRGIVVLRGRFPVGKRQTLKELSKRFGVSRERIRQVETQVSNILREAYQRNSPLPRIRTAIRLIHDHKPKSYDEVRDLLSNRGLATSEAGLSDFLSIWRAVDPTDSAIHDHLLLSRAIASDDYAFPEDLHLFVERGLTRLQLDLASEIMSIAKSQLRIIGAVSSDAIAASLEHRGCSARDVAVLLEGTELVEILPGYWGTVRNDYAVHRVAAKMLKVCGSLHIGHLYTGLMRHQKRQNKPVPPIDVLRAALRAHNAFEVDGRDVVHLLDLSRGPSPTLAEFAWLDTATKKGPVVHSSTVHYAFVDRGINFGLLHQLREHSELLQPLGERLYCLPGTTYTEQDIEAGRRQAQRNTRT